MRPARIGTCLLLGALAAAGCGRPAVAPQRPAPAIVFGGEPLELAPGRARLRALVLESQRKRVMGRLTVPRDVQRVVRGLAGAVAAAARQEAVVPALTAIARDQGVPVEEARRRWIAMHEADLLLESGGDPEIVSPAGAVGVSQWMLGSARRAGMRIDAARSAALTRRIGAMAAEEARLVAGGEPAARLPAVRAELERLRAARRRADRRYDPPAAIAAQARYLLGLYGRFPGFDWMLQAYHGGEAGVRRTLRRYLGAAWPGSTAAAIRRGLRGRRLSFEEVYFGATPRRHVAAFAYLYGRLDDHRYYGWKVLSARDLIALYRRDPERFRREWEALMPGRTREACWYPRANGAALRNSAAVRGALASGDLAPVRSLPGLRLLPAAQSRASSLAYAALRPPARGALYLTAALYRRAGGQGTLEVGDMAVPAFIADREPEGRPTRLPPGFEGALPGGGPPPDFDYHTTGLAFDLWRPADATARKRLEYALGYLSDRGALWWRGIDDAHGRRYHVVPNPARGRALAAIDSPAVAPPTPGL